MRCFPACFGHWRHKQTMKDVQDQCSSPSVDLHESVKLLPATMKEEDIVNPIQIVPESDNEATAVSNLNKGSNEPTSRNNDIKLEETENERIGHKDEASESSFLINDKDCVTKEITFVQEESSDSLFSLSIDSRKHVFAVEMEDREVNSPLLRSCHVLKYDEDKENVGLSKDQIIKQSSDHHQLKKKSQSEVAVDTSLSSWLVASEKSNKKTSMDSSPQSEKNYGEREILGAITSAAEMNGVLSGGDDQLGIGTVGSYWRRREAVVDMGTEGVLTVCTKV